MLPSGTGRCTGRCVSRGAAFPVASRALVRTDGSSGLPRPVQVALAFRRRLHRPRSVSGVPPPSLRSWGAQGAQRVGDLLQAPVLGDRQGFEPKQAGSSVYALTPSPRCLLKPTLFTVSSSCFPLKYSDCLALLCVRIVLLPAYTPDRWSFLVSTSVYKTNVFLLKYLIHLAVPDFAEIVPLPSNSLVSTEVTGGVVGKAELEWADEGHTPSRSRL